MEVCAKASSGNRQTASAKRASFIVTSLAAQKSIRRRAAESSRASKVCRKEIPRPAGENAGRRDDVGSVENSTDLRMAVAPQNDMLKGDENAGVQCVPL